MKRLIVLLLLLALAGSVSAGVNGPFQNDPGDSGGSSSCSYCGQNQCGCAPPPLGYYLVSSCTCSSVQCSRSCDYYRM
jgi:hypothetical protein